MPLAVIAEIGSRLRIVGSIGLHAVSHAIIVARRRACGSAVIIVTRPRRIIPRPIITL